MAIFLGGDAAQERQIDRIDLRAVRIEQIAEAEPPRFANGPVAARQRNITKMGATLESGEIGHQKFPAPDLAVRAEPGSVECDADDFVGDPVLGHATRDVRVMMLDADLWKIRHLQRELGAQILRMQIVSDRGGRDAEELLHTIQRFAIEDQRFVIFQIADVLAQERMMLLGEAKSALEFGAASQNLSHRKTQRHWMGCVAARTAQDALLAGEDARHRIVHASVNVAIVK